MTAGPTRCVTELARIGPLPAPGSDALSGRTALVIGGDQASRGSVTRALRGSGAAAIPLEDDAPAVQVVSALGRVDIVVDLNVSHLAEVAPQTWSSAVARTYEVLGPVVPEWARERRTGRCAYVPVMAFGGRLGADPHAIRQPLCGIWAGLAKTLPREVPAVAVRIVDTDDASDAGEAVVAELAAGRFQEVGWVNGRRHVLLPVRRAVEPAADAISPGEAVVLSGGGRGIGYHLARRLRATTGARVVVTGRADLDEFPGDELRCDDDAFASLRARRLSGVRGGAALREARDELARLQRARELAGNLAAARAAGEELDYRRCDVTDARSVRALLAGVQEPLAAVVHDAGIDRPARVERKSAESVQAVLSVKLDGFLTLLQEIERPVGRICAVGSLTGRYGGTAGQSDYAGANEALARVSEWVGTQRPEPVSCLSWPTWDSIGLITNPDAAVREMSAIPVDDGIAAWERELLARTTGEVLFLGALAPLSPAQLSSLPIPSNHPAREAALQRRRALGDLRGWRPGAEIETTHEFSSGTFPAAQGFLVRGRPAVPVGVALELLLDAATWLSGPGRAAGFALTEVEVRPDLLALPEDGPLELRRHATESTRSRGGGAFAVTLTAGGATAARATVVQRGSCGDDDVPSTATGRIDRSGELPDGSAPLAWPAAAGLLSRRPDGSRWRVAAERRRGSDAYAGLAAPEPALPAGVVEALAWASCPTHSAVGALRVAELRLGDGAVERCTEGLVDAVSGDAVAWDDEGRTVLRVRGLRWEVAVAA